MTYPPLPTLIRGAAGTIKVRRRKRPTWPLRLPLSARFLAYIDRPRDDSLCWHWCGAAKKGYGLFCVRKGRQMGAHRVSFLLAGRRIPGEFVLDHLCRNTMCVNPDHLEAVTTQENIRRGRNRKREQTHCKRGHEFTPENTANNDRRGPHRTCRKCAAMRAKFFRDEARRNA